jgi:uncharacterized membrane protein YgcG
MRLAARLLAVILLALAVLPAQAAEEIRSFRTDIAISADGTIRVMETLVVNVEGNQIQRGIFRDIPLRFEDESGRLREVDFDVVSVRRNGRDEPYSEERGSGILRIRIGDANVVLPRTTHTYEITYETNRQIRFFDSHDEFYWNVTGNGWDFPIREAVANIRLPQGVEAEDVTFFTGPFGSTEQAARAEELDGGNFVRVRATRQLGPREGLTVAVAMPKGSIAPPSAEQLRSWWLRDNLAMLIAGAGLALVLFYYVWAWARVGRDPPAGTMVPRWTPPNGVSPALANYIEQRGFKGQGWDAFSAAILNLAVKGHVELDQFAGDLTIRRKTNGLVSDLPVGEASILGNLPVKDDTLTVDKANGETVQKVGKSFRSAMEREHRNRFYRHNPGYLIVGVLLSAATIAATLIFGGIGEETIFALAGLTIPTIVVGVFAINAGRQFRRAKSLASRIAAVIFAAFAGFIGLTVITGIVTTALAVDFDMPVVVALAGLALVNLVFFFLMGAPTPIGRRLMDEIAGLKHYLSVAEEDRMNMQGAPTMSPRHFETLLPYAVALGVEKPWSRAFDAWLATAAAAGAAAYAGPAWYHGNAFSPGSIGTGLGGMAGSLSNSFTASLPAPKSSSSGFGGGGGGGFSGGGGGGGGGGGW